MVEESSRLRAAEYMIGAWALIALMGGVLSCWNGEFFWRGNAHYEDPYAKYNSHPVIRGTTVAATAVDAAIVFIVAFALTRRFWSPIQQRVMIVICLAGAALTWFELWYGSTFYYGEVRDKQGLPFGVNNAGVLGSIVFLSYVLWRLRVPRLTPGARIVARLAATLILVFAHWLAVRWLEQPWNLWQS